MSHCKHLDSEIISVAGSAIKARCNDCGLHMETSEEVPSKWICRLIRHEYIGGAARWDRQVTELSIARQTIRRLEGRLAATQPRSARGDHL